MTSEYNLLKKMRICEIEEIENMIIFFFVFKVRKVLLYIGNNLAQKGNNPRALVLPNWSEHIPNRLG